MKKKLILLAVMPFMLWLNVCAVNITVIRSVMASGYNGGEDTLWYNYAIAMGYNATLDSVTILNDTSFFATTDVLILSEATGLISNTQMQNIITFVKRGKSAYIQSEYLASYPGDIVFQSIMDSIGADFRWVGSVAGQLIPMQILAPFSTTPYQTSAINYFWYGLNGTGCGVDSFLDYNNQYFGFYYHRPNHNYGRVITVSDQDWVWEMSDSLLVKNMLYHLVEFDSTVSNNLLSIIPQSSTICSGEKVILKASGGTTYTWSPSAGLSSTTGDTVIATPTITTIYTILSPGACPLTGIAKVNVNPTLPLTIEPQSPSICLGTGIVLSVPVSGSNYTWSPALTLSSSTGDSVLATPVTVTTYTVSGTDSLGCTTTDSDVVFISPAPDKPTINQNGDVLTSSATQGNQWVRNDTTLQGATNQNYTVIVTGWYKVTAVNPANGCSTTSDSIFVNLSGIALLPISNNNQLSIYHNPTSGQFTIKLNGNQNGYTVEVYNVVGEKIYVTPKSPKGDFQKQSFDLSSQADGMYFVYLKSEEGVEVGKVLVTR